MIYDKKQVISENFINGIMPTYLSELNVNTSIITNGKLEVPTTVDVSNVRGLESDFSINPTDHNRITLTLYDLYFDDFTELLSYIGLHGDTGNYIQLQFAQGGANDTRIMIFVLKDGVVNSYTLVYSLPLTPSKPMDFVIDYNINKGYIDILIEHSTYRFTWDAPTVPLSLYMNILSREPSTVKRLGLGGYKLELY